MANPLNEAWMLLSVGKQIASRIETKQIYSDAIGNISTLYVSPLEKDYPVVFDMALKGTYEDDELEWMQLTEEENTAPIDSLIRQNLSDSIAFHYYGYNVDSVSNKVYSLTHNGNTFKTIHHKFHFADEFSSYEYATLIGIAPDGSMMLLAFDDVQEMRYSGFRVLRVKNDYLLIVQDSSTGEGAAGTGYVYKLTTKFE